MSTLLADTIRKTGGTAGVDIRVKNTSVYESDGGTSVTQNLVQGLVKSWYCLQGTDTFGLKDSFNTASATDNGEGDYTTARTNAFSNDDYATAALCSSTGGSSAHYNFTVENQDYRLRSTTSLRTYILNSQSGQGSNDALDSSVSFMGDLA
jgi:hypothetical protein